MTLPNPHADDLPLNHTSGARSIAARKAILAANRRRAEMKAQGIPPKVLDPLEKAAANPRSLRLAINAKCFDCEGGNADPAVQRRIGTCEIRTCPLWTVRPYQQRGAR